MKQLIQFGTLQGVADIVLQDSDDNYIAIVMCKHPGIEKEFAMSELKSYLSATDAQFGILAFGIDPEHWIFCENQRNNWFVEIPRDIFESRISKWHPNARDSATIRDLEHTIYNLRKKIRQEQKHSRRWRWFATFLGIVLILGCGVLLFHVLYGW